MYLDEARIGMERVLPGVVIDKQRMLDFARLYDPIPLHLDEEYAKTTRYGGLIAPGVMSFMAVWAEYTRHDFFGEELIAGKSTKIEWHKPVYAGDTLTGKVCITNIIRRNAYNGIAELTTVVTNQHGETVLTNVTESVVIQGLKTAAVRVTAAVFE